MNEYERPLRRAVSWQDKGPTPWEVGCYTQITHSLECASGSCWSGCSHLFWECNTCDASGGWGSSSQKLEEYRKNHENYLHLPKKRDEYQSWIKEGQA